MPRDNDKASRGGSYFAPGRKRTKKWVMIISIIIIVILIASVTAAIVFKPTPVLAVDGIPCERSESVTFHTHSHLDVLIDGSPQPLPANVGVLVDKCLYWLHVHSNDGIIHEEAPRNMVFTLGQLMDIWNQTKPDTMLSNSLSSKPVSVYVNGVKTDQAYKDIVLTSHEQIALIIGTQPASIPSTYPSSGPPN